jgi:hypothetical protein
VPAAYPDWFDDRYTPDPAWVGPPHRPEASPSLKGPALVGDRDYWGMVAKAKIPTDKFKKPEWKPLTEDELRARYGVKS